MTPETVGPSDEQMPKHWLMMVLLAAFALPSVHGAAAAELKVWIKAFIPNALPANPTYIVPVPNAPGKWMIPGPSLGFLEALSHSLSDIPLTADTCFATDDRTYSPDPRASARLATGFVVQVDGTKSIAPLNGNSITYTGQSTAYSCHDGAELVSIPGNLSGSSVDGPHVDGSRTEVVIRAAASMPFFIGAPNIDYSGVISYDSSTRQLSYEFNADRFPAYEAYAQMNNGPVKQLFALDPSGATAWSLFDLGTGIGQRSLSGQVRFEMH